MVVTIELAILSFMVFLLLTFVYVGGQRMFRHLDALQKAATETAEAAKATAEAARLTAAAVAREAMEGRADLQAATEELGKAAAAGRVEATARADDAEDRDEAVAEDLAVERDSATDG